MQYDPVTGQYAESEQPANTTTVITDAPPAGDPNAWMYDQANDPTSSHPPADGHKWEWRVIAGKGQWFQTPVATNTPPAQTPPSDTPDPNAGPDGSTTPNMDGPDRVGGYWLHGHWVGGTPRNPAADPTNTQTPGPTGAGPVSDGNIGGTQFDFPAYENAPVFDYPAFTEKFSYDAFKPSSWADAENEPGYAAARDQLKKQVEAGAAYKGTVRSGMTIGDVYKNLDSQAQQNFSGFDQRNFRNWQAGKDLALDTYGTKFGAWQGNRDLGKMSYDSIWNNTNAKNNFQYNVASEKFRDLLDRWKTQVQSLTSIATAGANS